MWALIIFLFVVWVAAVVVFIMFIFRRDEM